MVVGSRAFFTGLPNFRPKDIDYLHIIEKSNNPDAYKYVMHTIRPNRCDIYLVLHSKQKLINYALTKAPGMAINRFLVPEFNELIGFNINDLEKLRPMLKKLGDRHKYLQVIFDAYISNNGFYLTDEQRENAYTEYKKYRKS